MVVLAGCEVSSQDASPSYRCELRLERQEKIYAATQIRRAVAELRDLLGEARHRRLSRFQGVADDLTRLQFRLREENECLSG